MYAVGLGGQRDRFLRDLALGAQGTPRQAGDFAAIAFTAVQIHRAVNGRWIAPQNPIYDADGFRELPPEGLLAAAQAGQKLGPCGARRDGQPLQDGELERGLQVVDFLGFELRRFLVALQETH